MAVPEFIENVFKWLPVDCQEKQWCKKWRARELQKDDKQRKLDKDYYNACYTRQWEEARLLFSHGSTNDFITEWNGATPFIYLYSYQTKTIMDERIKTYPQEYERSMEVLSAVQNQYSKETRTTLEPICGTEKWMGTWKEAGLTKDFDQLVKDVALFIACDRKDWELAEKWIDRGATNNCVNQSGSTALHLAAQNGNSKILESILDRFPEEIEKKNRRFQSALCYAFANKQYDIAKILIKKKAKNPIAQLMLNWHGNIECGLFVIYENLTDLKGQLKTDFEFIQTAKLTGLISGISSRLGIQWNTSPEQMRSMADLIQVCETKYHLSVPKIIQETFGKKMIVNDELTWRYEKASKKSFVASYFKNKDITHDLTLTKIGTNVTVNIS